MEQIIQTNLESMMQEYSLDQQTEQTLQMVIQLDLLLHIQDQRISCKTCSTSSTTKPPAGSGYSESDYPGSTRA